MIFDIHTHILPGVDDGSSCFEESLQMLEMAEQQGVTAVVATPHYYHDEQDFSEYSALVDLAYSKLLSRYQGDIKIYKGYEVRYFKGISKTDAVKKMTLNGSDYLLLELSYSEPITDSVLEEIEALYHNYRITPIIAHIERYARYHGFRRLLSLIDDGIVMAHVNTASFSNEYKRRSVELLKSGFVNVVATDMHSADLRPPDMKNALLVVNDVLGVNVLRKLSESYDRLYNEIVLK